MIEIRHLIAESGANKFGTCNCCGKSSGEDPLMISIKFSYYGHGTLICLCDDCKKKLTEALPPANNSEIPNSSDTISRAKAIEALEKDMASLDHIINGMSANDVRLDAYVSQRNQVNYDIYTINNLPPAQPEQLGTNLAEVGTDCISRQAAIDTLRGYLVGKRCPDDGTLTCRLIENEVINKLPPAQPEPNRGRWIYKTDLITAPTGYWECSECKEGRLLYEENFCPNCGAKMREVTT